MINATNNENNKTVRWANKKPLMKSFILPPLVGCKDTKVSQKIIKLNKL